MKWHFSLLWLAIGALLGLFVLPGVWGMISRGRGMRPVPSRDDPQRVLKGIVYLLF